MSYRVVYFETIPAWERIFPSLREAIAFAKEHKTSGDVIFSIRKVVPGEPPQSLTAAVEAGMVVNSAARAPAKRKGGRQACAVKRSR